MFKDYYVLTSNYKNNKNQQYDKNKVPNLHKLVNPIVSHGRNTI